MAGQCLCCFFRSTWHVGPSRTGTSGLFTSKNWPCRGYRFVPLVPLSFHYAPDVPASAEAAGSRHSI